MGDVVNLRRARKSRARAEKAAEADRNRLAFGRSKAETRATEAEAERREKGLDAHLVGPSDHQGTEFRLTRPVVTARSSRRKPGSSPVACVGTSEPVAAMVLDPGFRRDERLKDLCQSPPVSLNSEPWAEHGLD